MIRQVADGEIEIDTGTLLVRAQSECPHRKGRLRFGFVNTRRMSITCPLHHSTFDLRTGTQLSGPPCGSLRVSVLSDTEKETAPAAEPTEVVDSG